MANTYSGTTTIAPANCRSTALGPKRRRDSHGIVNLNGGTLVNNTGATLTLANIAQWGSNFGAGGTET